MSNVLEGAIKIVYDENKGYLDAKMPNGDPVPMICGIDLLSKIEDGYIKAQITVICDVSELGGGKKPELAVTIKAEDLERIYVRDVNKQQSRNF
jgi:hypothetical protein